MCLSVTVWQRTTRARRFILLMPAKASRRATTLTMLEGAALSSSEPSAAGQRDEDRGQRLFTPHGCLQHACTTHP